MVSDCQLAVEESTREQLFKLKNGPNDTYDNVINRLMSEAEGPTLDHECPICDEDYNTCRSMENGQWSNEPLDVFGINDIEGHFCMSWDANQLFIYYHD